jgi:Icc protein
MDAPFVVGQISDLHIGPPGKLLFRRVDSAAMLARAVQEILRLPQKPDVMVITGDLVDTGHPDEYAHLRRLLAPLPMPYYLLPGNHDERAALRQAFPEHAYLRQWEPFIQYAIDDWPLRLVALDTVIPGEPGGRLDQARLEWLGSALSREPRKPTLILMHHPPFPTFIAHMDGMVLEEPQALAAVVARHPQVERLLCGHLHRPIQFRFAGTLASTCPSTAHQVALDTLPQAPPKYNLEPPGFQLHAWRAGAGVVSHTAPIGDFAGPYSFG